MPDVDPPRPRIPRGLPSVLFTEATTVRMISTAHIDEPAMAPLAETEDQLRVLEDLEALTSRRQDKEMPLPSGVRRSELMTAAHGYGHTYINAAFCYTRPTGNRFNGPERGAWYASWGKGAVETAQAEVAWHLARELDNVGVYENVTDYRELLAGFTAQFVDLQGHGPVEQKPEPYLGPDPATAYPAGQALARELRAAEVPGVLYPSLRQAGGRCLAAFRPNLVQNVRQGARWRFTWSGMRDPDIRMA